MTHKEGSHPPELKRNWQEWEQKYVPWATQFLDFDQAYIWNSSNSVRLWAAENLEGRCELTLGYGYFEFEEDKVLFALRWL